MKQQHQWYGLDGTVLDIGEDLDEGLPADQASIDPSTGNRMFQSATLVQNDAETSIERIIEFDTKGVAHLSSIEIPAHNAGTPLSRNRPNANTRIEKFPDGSYVFGWSNDTIARLDSSHHLRLTKISF